MDIKTYRTKADAINADLAALFEKHGLKMGKLTASVNESGGTVRYTITAADQNLKDARTGESVTPDHLYYVKSASLYGLKPEWLGQAFASGGRTYTVVGLKNTRARNKVVVRRDGEQSNRVAPVEMVTNAFQLAEFKKNSGAA
jgi:hypothetical protein